LALVIAAGMFVVAPMIKKMMAAEDGPAAEPLPTARMVPKDD